MRTILVLTGSTKEEDVERFPYRPTMVVKSIAEVAELVAKLAPVDTTA
jgi:NagD protein